MKPVNIFLFLFPRFTRLNLNFPVFIDLNETLQKCLHFIESNLHSYLFIFAWYFQNIFIPNFGQDHEQIKLIYVGFLLVSMSEKKMRK